MTASLCTLYARATGLPSPVQPERDLIVCRVLEGAGALQLRPPQLPWVTSVAQGFFCDMR